MKTRPYLVRSHKQLLALASPGREDMIDAVGVLGIDALASAGDEGRGYGAALARDR
jgi:hypothetical protein